MKLAVITGVFGQDGSYLAEHLLALGYKVVGISRRHSTDALSWGWLEHLKGNPDFILESGDITDPIFLTNTIIKHKPDEWFNLGAMSHVGHSFTNPHLTFETDACSVVLQLSLLHQHCPDVKFYQASTSELFGGLNCPATGYNESSPLYPRSPYGVAKLAAHWSTINFREAYGMFACAGILFNHESPRRGLDFVTRKVTSSVARIKLGLDQTITMGNLEAYRDWGHAADYVEVMHLMLQQDKPEEFVISTGIAHSIKELLAATFEIAGLGSWEKYVKFDEKFMRPSEVPFLLGNSDKAKSILYWTPSRPFIRMIEDMYKADYLRVSCH